MTKEKHFINTTVFSSEKNSQHSFLQIIKNNKRKTTKAINFFLLGVKNEAIETKDASRIIVKFIATQKITKKEEKQLKLQVYDLFKILGIGIPFMLIPGATLLIPFILKAAEKKGINLLPSNFNGKNVKNKKD
jgi:Sec-independent protein secretion pathway component TatC